MACRDPAPPSATRAVMRALGAALLTGIAPATPGLAQGTRVVAAVDARRAPSLVKETFWRAWSRSSSMTCRSVSHCT
jgi:hypothetical protein